MEKESKYKLIGHSAVLVTTLFSSINVPVSKYLTSSGVVSGEAVTLWRASVACVCFWLISMFVPNSRNEKVAPKDMLVLLGGAAFGMSFNLLAFLVGFKEVSTIDASIIGSMIPLFTMVLAAVFLSEPISVRKVLGVAFGLAGGMLIIFSGVRGQLGGSSLWGIALHTFAAFSYGTYLIVNRSIASRYHPLTISRWMFLFATLLLLPFVGRDLFCSPLLTGDYAGDVNTLDIWLGMLYVALGNSVIGYMLVPVSLRYIRPTTASMYNYLQPLIASLIAILWGQDVLTVHKPISGILIFIGVYLVTTSKKKVN